MQIKLLTRDDFDAYTAFREKMWPTYSVGGVWETIEEKYIRNPLIRQCPGSGLLACFQSGAIVGVMGAYPMPITFEGTVYPGHMVADWAVLPQHHTGLVPGALFQEFLRLPGRKYGSCGTPPSERSLSRRGIRLPAVIAAAVLDPLRALVLERLRFRRYALPSTVSALPFSLPGRAESIEPRELEPAMPVELAKTAFVKREADFWGIFVSARSRNSALALRLWGEGCRGSAVIRLLEVGPLRHAILLAFRAEPPTPEAVGQLARSLRAALRALKACVILATEADAAIRHCLTTVGLHVVRKSTYWWAFPRPSDSFAVQDARWWLTSAERDSHWGILPPGLVSQD